MQEYIHSVHSKFAGPLQVRLSEALCSAQLLSSPQLFVLIKAYPDGGHQRDLVFVSLPREQLHKYAVNYLLLNISNVYCFQKQGLQIARQDFKQI